MKKWYKKWWGLALFFLLTIILIIISASFFYMVDIFKKELTNNSIGGKKNNVENISRILYNNNNYWIGSSEPKITIVEFGDFACPYCKASFPNIREISLKYKNSVKIIYRDFPVISKYSPNLAMAARCAGEQGLFWLMHDKLFLNQGISLKKDIIELAAQVGVNQDRFAKCFEIKKYLSDIEKDIADGKKLDVTGTPTWFINGEKIAGDIPYDTFVDIINNILNEK